jgi:hypothetical protein
MKHESALFRRRLRRLIDAGLLPRAVTHDVYKARREPRDLPRHDVASAARRGK